MFTSDVRVEFKAAKDPKGKKAIHIVLMPSFCNDVVYVLKPMGPNVCVLRLVDNEKRPALGYIYEAMDKTKEAIQKAFNGIRRWDCQFHHPLHATDYLLNLEFFYSNLNIKWIVKCWKAFTNVLIGLVKMTSFREEKNHDGSWQVGKFPCKFAYLITFQIANLSDHFDTNAYELHCSLVMEDLWSTYTTFAKSCHFDFVLYNVTKFVKLLYIHSKKRSRLEHQKLQELHEWIVGELDGDGEDVEDELIFDEVLTWRDVANATEAVEPLKYTRRQKQMQRAADASTSKKEKGKGVVEEEDEDESSQDEVEEYLMTHDKSEDFEIVPALCTPLMPDRSSIAGIQGLQLANLVGLNARWSGQIRVQVCSGLNQYSKRPVAANCGANTSSPANPRGKITQLKNLHNGNP
ncbi:hypothetical protein CR513_46855, partial [Mucuna pruriens]